MTSFQAPGKTSQAKDNPAFGQEPTGQGTSGQGDGEDNGNSSRTNINQLNQLKIQQSEANWARKVIKNPAPIYLKLRSFNEGVLTDYLLYGLVNDTIKKNLKRATGSVIESFSLVVFTLKHFGKNKGPFIKNQISPSQQPIAS